MADKKRQNVTKAAPPAHPELPDLKGKSTQMIDLREIGSSGLRRFSGFVQEEFLPELTGWTGMATFKEMGLNDPTVGAILFAIRTLCRRVPWMTEAASDSPEDEDANDFLESCMDDMSQTWIDTIDEILSFLLYGFSVHETCYKKRLGDSKDPAERSSYNDGRIGWRKIPIRSQDTIYRWHFDENGGIQGIQQLAPPRYMTTDIGMEKLLLFRTTVEKNNPEGRSIFRNAYRSWYMKKNIENIEAIGIERDLAGLPFATVPAEIMSPNASSEQKTLLAQIEKIVTNIRRDAQEGVVFPAIFDPVSQKPLYDLKLLSTGGQRQFDTDKIVNRYDQRIAMTCLADFILLGQDKVGSFALASSKTNLFATAIGSVLDIVCDVFNRYAIPRLFALNSFTMSGFPKIKHGDLDSVDMKELGAYIQALAASGYPLFPNPELEKFLMKVANLPEPPDEANEGNARIEMKTPPKPGSQQELRDPVKEQKPIGQPFPGPSDYKPTKAQAATGEGAQDQNEVDQHAAQQKSRRDRAGL